MLETVLFAVFTSDITSIVDPRCNPSLFADDLKLFVTVSKNVDFSLLRYGFEVLPLWLAVVRYSGKV